MSAQLGLTHIYIYGHMHTHHCWNINALHTQSLACFWGLAFLPADPFHPCFALFPSSPPLLPPLPLLGLWSDRMVWLADYICKRFITGLHHAPSVAYLFLFSKLKCSLHKPLSTLGHARLYFPSIWLKGYGNAIKICYSKIWSVYLLIQSAAEISVLCVKK